MVPCNETSLFRQRIPLVWVLRIGIKLRIRKVFEKLFVSGRWNVRKDRWKDSCIDNRFSLTWRRRVGVDGGLDEAPVLEEAPRPRPQARPHPQAALQGPHPVLVRVRTATSTEMFVSVKYVTYFS